jgi:7-carboxy-7-deazaguanine synthase
VAQAWFADLDWLIVSPKPPSSGMTTDWSALNSCIAAAKDRVRCALKIVVFNEDDYAYAQTVAARSPSLPIYLQVGNLTAPHAGGGTSSDEADISDLMGRLRWLAERTVKDRWFDATVLPQLHVLAWGNKRGV